MISENQMFWGQAVMALYPNVAYMTDWVNAWDKDNNPVQYDSALVEPKANELMETFEKEQCSNTAKQLIAATDWSVLPDVNLTNKADFESYRATLRNLILNPVVNPVWPTEPQPVWGS